MLEEVVQLTLLLIMEVELVEAELERILVEMDKMEQLTLEAVVEELDKLLMQVEAVVKEFVY